MLEKSQRDLRRSIRRKLAVRLLLACLPLALTASVAVYLFERDRYGDDVLSWTASQAALFNAVEGGALDRLGDLDAGRLERAIDDFEERYEAGPLGRFDALEVHLETGELVGRVVRERAIEGPVAVALLGSPRFPAGAEAWTGGARSGGDRRLLVQTPLYSSHGVPVGWMRGVFTPSEAVVARVRRRAARASAAVALVVSILGLSLWPLVAKLIDRLARLSGSLLEANLGTLDALGRALAKRDGDTEEHSLRVTIVSVLLAEELGIDRPRIQHLIKGAALHDVGKIAIRDEILLKPGKLTDEEYEEMKSHVAHGVDIVGRSSWLEPAMEVVHNHHERFGGGGYLHGLSGAEIPLAARIFAIVDVFDALASTRPYKPAMDLERTLEIMRAERGTHFDPELLDTFERMAPEIHRRLYRASVGELEAELDRLVDRYFSGGLDALEVV